jgi:putative FmdB family regulatory protein
MPIFEYNCKKCGYKFDRMVFRADNEVKCPICQSRVEKLFSSFAVGRSQGTGFNPSPSFEPKICKNC